MKMAEDTFSGMMLIDISGGGHPTKAGYRLTSEGLNNRDVKKENVAHLWEGTDEGAAIHWDSPEYALTAAMSVMDLDQDCLTTDMKGPFNHAALCGRVEDQAGTIYLLNGAHRVEMSREYVINPLLAEKRDTERYMEEGEEDDPQYPNFVEQSRQLDAKLEKSKYWLAKVYDIGE